MSNTSCGCNSSNLASPVNSPSWYDVFRAVPENPLNILANAKLNGLMGTFTNNASYATPGTWVASSASIASEVTVSSLATDESASVALAEQWNFGHQTADTLGTLPPPLRKVIYLKAGTRFENKIPINLGGGTYDQFHLSYRDNAGTRGDAAGTIPTVSWTGLSIGGIVTLDVVLKSPGFAVMGLVVKNASSGDWSMFEMEWIIVD